jgi:hypothetical protein
MVSSAFSVLKHKTFRVYNAGLTTATWCCVSLQGQSRGFGFVHFEDAETARQAAQVSFATACMLNLLFLAMLDR